MSVPHSLLALLRRGPMYGYQLRAEFEGATGGTWPLNIGQVYTTLTRLERDRLVAPRATDEEGRHRYELTPSGREAVAAWFARPVTLGDRPRDELAIKLALAALHPGARDDDVRRVVQSQRTATMRRLQDLTRLKRDPAQSHPRDSAGDGAGDLAWSLVLDNLRYMAEAELRWLDHCESALARAVRPSGGTPANGTTARPAPAVDGPAQEPVR